MTRVRFMHQAQNFKTMENEENSDMCNYWWCIRYCVIQMVVRMSIKKELLEDYELVPFGEITEEAKAIAVLWVEGYEPMGFDLPGKHKLASDIMNYARRYHKQQTLFKTRQELRSYMRKLCIEFDKK